MKNLLLQTTILSLIFLCACSNPPPKEKVLDPSLSLWYNSPASEWVEALPIGNGRLGAMIYGGVESDTIQFNEETLWTGQPHEYANEGAYEVLDDLRDLLWEGKQVEAHALGNEKFMSEPLRQLSYQPFGNILLNVEGHEGYENYKRQLDLENALSSVSYEVNGIEFRRESFASAPDQAIVIQLTSSEKAQLNFEIGLSTPHSQHDIRVEGDEIILTGKVNDYPKESSRGVIYPESKLTFEARLKIILDGGKTENRDGNIKVVNANSATLQLVAASSFVNFQQIDGNPQERCTNDLSNLQGKEYKALKERHIKDYQTLFKRVDLDLGQSDISKRPTNERLVSFAQDQDPNLAALLFQYGRYLLISSSRSGTQPANLQGIWNDQLSPPWDSKYTININTEMNYWLAEITNLSELAEPLHQMVEDLAWSGVNTAKEHYNYGGWVAHHNTDIWRGSAPINNANHGIWVTGGAWLSQHLWWHYQFTEDEEFLRNKAYPILKEASLFFDRYLVPSPENPEWLISGPSNSPETGGLVMGPTMDHQIIRNLFSNTIEAAEILGVDSQFVQTLKEKRSKIAPNQIGKHGQLQEWLEDKDDPENKHRHVSHLWGLHPGNEIHPLTTPELAEACKVTLSHRGDGGTGWSRAWKINFWARLLDGDHAFLLLKNLIVPANTQNTDYGNAGGLYPNLFDAHPPFQIDGNFGATSGMTEMLLQSHLRNEGGEFYQDILPALPTAFPQGKIAGIVGRGGFEFTIQWKDQQLVSVDIISRLGNPLNVRHAGKEINMETKIGEVYAFKVQDFK